MPGNASSWGSSRKLGWCSCTFVQPPPDTLPPKEKWPIDEPQASMFSHLRLIFAKNKRGEKGWASLHLFATALLYWLPSMLWCVHLHKSIKQFQAGTKHGTGSPILSFPSKETFLVSERSLLLTYLFVLFYSRRQNKRGSPKNDWNLFRGGEGVVSPFVGGQVKNKHSRDSTIALSCSKIELQNLESIFLQVSFEFTFLPNKVIWIPLSCFSLSQSCVIFLVWVCSVPSLNCSIIFSSRSALSSFYSSHFRNIMAKGISPQLSKAKMGKLSLKGKIT